MRISGPEALEIASGIFQPVRGRSLASGPSGQPRFGRFGGDEVVALVLAEPHREVEVHGHGGQAAIRAILEALEARGVVLDPADSSVRNESMQAHAMLQHAQTLRVAGILLDQLDGAVERELEEIRTLTNRDDARVRAEALLERASLGRKLEHGWKLVITGRPNVGKSRLLNALAGFDRSIVSPQAGTTRDVVTFQTAIDGWPVEIADTAGIRSGTEGIEASGIDRAREQGGGADLVLLVLDRSEPLTREDHVLMATYGDAIRIANKSDLAHLWDEQALGALAVSAECGGGIASLINEISRRLVPNPPPKGAAIPLREDLVEFETLAAIFENDR